MHCIILYFVATCKRPFGLLLLNKMKDYMYIIAKADGRALRKNVSTTVPAALRPPPTDKATSRFAVKQITE